MGNLFNCVQEEVPYELAVTAVDLSGVGEGAPDIQLTISLGDKSETTPKGQLQVPHVSQWRPAYGLVREGRPVVCEYVQKHMSTQ